MEIMSVQGALLVIVGVIVALFLFDYAATQGWTGSKPL